MRKPAAGADSNNWGVNRNHQALDSGKNKGDGRPSGQENLSGNPSESLDGMIDLLNDGGRLCVITFHSLEDRIVKNIFRKNEHPCTCPPEFPVCVCGKKSKGTVVTRKPILPGEEEMETNPRSKSAKLRVFERKV